MTGGQDLTVGGPVFTYSEAVAKRYPAIQAGVVHASGVTNGSSPAGLLDAYRDEQRGASRRLQETAIADLPSISAWRRAFSDFGTKPTQYRNAAEALLRRLDKHGDVPSVNALVDIGNVVAIRHAVPVAVFDLARIDPPITVRFASGNERFTDLGTSESVHPERGEVVFVDHQGVVVARRWCWRQSAESATAPSTVQVLFVIEALHEAGAVDVDAAASGLEELLRLHQPGSLLRTWRLSATDRNAV